MGLRGRIAQILCSSVASTASGAVMGVPSTLPEPLCLSQSALCTFRPRRIGSRCAFAASSRRMLAASSRRDHFTPPTSRWRRSTDSATTSIASGTPPVPLPYQREAGFQQAAGRIGGQSPTAYERAISGWPSDFKRVRLFCDDLAVG